MSWGGGEGILFQEEKYLLKNTSVTVYNSVCVKTCVTFFLISYSLVKGTLVVFSFLIQKQRPKKANLI